MDEVLIGEIIKPHGVQGELKVFPITHEPKRFRKLKEVTLAKDNLRKSFSILNVKVQEDAVYLVLEGINNRDSAEQYRGWRVMIDRTEVPPLKEGWYYFELEGIKVYEGDSFLGTLSQIIETGCNDVYLVKGPQGEICVPALKTVVKNVDIQARRMEVELPPGLVEDD